MVLFENCSVLLELKSLPFKEKTKLRSAITDNGGRISFVVNEQCSLVVASDASSLSSNRLRSVQKHRTPVVGLDYVYSCLRSGLRLPVDEFRMDPLSPSPLLATSHPVSKQTSEADSKVSTVQGEPHYSDGLSQRGASPERSGNVLETFRIYTEADLNLPTFPDNFQVAKYSVFEKVNSSTWSVLELQSANGGSGQRYRVVRYWKDDIGTKKAAVKDKLVYLSTSEDALQVYLALRDALQGAGLQLRSDSPSEALDLGSGPLQQLLLEEKLNTGSLSQDVGVFVELLWTEALGCLGNVLSVNISRLSLNDVSRAEGLLLQAQRKLKEGNYTEAATLLEDAYTLLPHKEPQLLPSVKLISQKLDLCQLIRDVLNVSEMTLRSPVPSCVGKYRALRCSIEAVPSSGSEFQSVAALLQDSKVQIQQVLRVGRGLELQMFKSELGNVKPLLHSSNPTNFVGILSRGLLLPRTGVEHHGIERTDVGNLGSGIYFSDSISTSLKYSTPCMTDGSRLLLVCDVALGVCRDLHKRDFTLTRAPDGHHSVHGVRRTPRVDSEFEDEEYVVYSPDQVKLKYVVQFSLQGDQRKDFTPVINTSAELSTEQEATYLEVYRESDGVEAIKPPQDDVKAGLLDSSGKQLPLQAVHVKGKLIDLLSQVVIFQKYTNTSSVPIEAKYVFPLDESAAVCGFEAFINGKHIVGQVKEKEAARKEYKQAVEKGHGAYLMDQDAPDVFTISVGNLPPGATVLIKVTFVSELIVKDGSIFFSLPGSVAPWQERAALNQTTQVTLEKVCVTDDAASSREFSLDMSVEMPYEISSLECLTHKVQIKRTDCKAVLSVVPGVVMGPEGFQLSVTLSEVHLPRMWVEKRPDKDSQACMLVFYPEFEISSSSASDEVVLLLDTSESMKGESLRMAQRIALQVLKTLDPKLRVNVILFGTDHKEAFLAARPVVEAREAAQKFIKFFLAIGGSTELWRPLRALSLLPPSRGFRNLLLLSDGHIQNPEPTLKLLRANAQHSRLFSCGLSSTANRHMLRALAQAGAGAYEFFDTKTKHTWAEKVARQVKRMASPGCSSVSVKWQQFSTSAPRPVQAPKQIHALFNDCHTLVYGFVPHCTQAKLLGNLSGQELETMVSTTELQKTSGTFLHKLTARALIRDYEDGNLDADEAEHEGRKAELKSYIVELSKEFSVLSQFTSFVAIEERDSDESGQGFTDIPKLIAEEDVDILPYISWTSSVEKDEEMYEETDEEMYEEMCEDSVHYASPPLRKRAVRQSAPPDPVQPYLKTGFICVAPAPLSQLNIFTGQTLSPDSLLASSPPLPPSAHLQAPASKTFSYGAAEAAPPPRSFSHAQSAARQIFSQAAPLGAPPHLPPPFAQLRLSAKAVALAAPPQLPPPSARLHLSASRVVSQAATLADPPFLTPTAGDYSAECLRVREKSGKGRTRLDVVKDLMPVHRRPVISCSASAVSDLPLMGSARPLTYDLRSDHAQPTAPHSFMEMSGDALPPPSAQLQLSASRVVSQAATLADPPPLALPLAGYIRLKGVRKSEAVPPPPPPPVAAPPPPDGNGHARLDMLKNLMPVQHPHVMSCSAHFRRDHEQHSLHSFLDLSGAADALYDDIEPVTIPQSGRIGGARAPSRSSTSQFMSNVTGSFPTSGFLGDNIVPMSSQSFTVTECFGPQPLAVLKSDLSFMRISPEPLKLDWTKIFDMQHTEGHWELTAALGELINVDVDVFNVFLKNKGINSLGVKACAEILRLVATLLVLQLMRAVKLKEGKLLRTLFCLEESEPRPKHWKQVKLAVDWVCWADRQYPCICSRLEFGFSWESATRQLLGYEDPPPFSPLTGLKLQKHRKNPLPSAGSSGSSTDDSDSSWSS